MGLNVLLIEVLYSARTTMCQKLGDSAMDTMDIKENEQGHKNTLQMSILMHIIEIKLVRMVRDFPHTKENSICMSFFTSMNIKHTVSLPTPSCHTLL
jgi:hypothetical protein